MSEKLYSIDGIKNIIVPIARKYGIPAFYLFGSYARSTANIDSDIDLLVDTAGTELNSLFALGVLYTELEQAFGKHIDLITVNSFDQNAMMPSDLRFRERVMEERVNIYATA